MSLLIRQIIGGLSLMVLLVGSSASVPARPTGAVASGFMEVRLRKIHLVRPDLIPYPIAYEIDC